MSYRPQIKADSNGTTQDLPLDAETVQGKTPIFTTTNQQVAGVKTYTDIQKFIGGITLYAESGDSPRLTFQRGTLINTYNEWSLYDSGGYFCLQQRGQGSIAWETRAAFTQSDVNFAGTIKEDGTPLANKYAAKSDVYTKTETDNKYLPLIGGTLSGNLTGKYITGTWLQTTAATDLGKAPPKYGVISEGGWLYTRTLEETKSDLGINDKVGSSEYSSNITYLCDDPINFFADYTENPQRNEQEWYTFIRNLGFMDTCYLHTIRALQQSSPASYIVFSFISTRSTAYTKSTLYSAFPDKGFQASGFYNYSSSNAGYRVNIVYPQSATTILFDHGNNSGATATYGGTYFVDNVRKIT